VEHIAADSLSRGSYTSPQRVSAVSEAFQARRSHTDSRQSWVFERCSDDGTVLDRNGLTFFTLTWPVDGVSFVV
jgi:hypothetical protein